MTLPTAAATITVRKFFGIAVAMICVLLLRFRNDGSFERREILASNLLSRKYKRRCCAAPTCPRIDSAHLPQLLQDRRILERRYVLGNLLALGDVAQKPAHDLARARLGQVV